MKKILLIGVSVLAMAVAGGAQAADLKPVYTKAPKAVPYNWTGLYMGIQGGFGFGNADNTRPGFDSGTYAPQGALVGGTIGYNWQYAGNWVVGLEGDAAWADLSASWPGAFPGVATTSMSQCGGVVPRCYTALDNIETVRARWGYAFGYVFPYVTGGVAIATLKGSEGDVATGGAFGSGSNTEAGWTVGAGVESVLMPHWTVKLEGLYVDMGNQHLFNATVPGTPTTVVAESVKYNTAIIKLGINYKIW
jgi:outer membrane immunogenic protein